MNVGMENVLISPSDIESCWEKSDACFVKMKSGKVWVCELYIDVETCKISDYAVGGYTTLTKLFTLNLQDILYDININTIYYDNPYH